MLVCKIRLTNNIIQHTKVSIFKDDRCVKMAYNGKRIAEVREKGSRNFQLYPNVSKMFFRELNYEKPVKRKTFCG